MSTNSHTRAWVLAYGSNMHLGDLRRWLREHGHGTEGILQAAGATLEGWRLAWHVYSAARQGGAAGVERHRASRLHGVALLVDAPTLAAIDTKESHPQIYDRGDTPHDVQLHHGAHIRAWLYVVRPTARAPHSVPPTEAYLKLLIDGARQHGLPAAYIDALERTPTQTPRRSS